MTAGERLIELSKQKDSLMTYLRMKVEAEDWHAVADAAMDLREVEAATSHLRVFATP